MLKSERVTRSTVCSRSVCGIPQRSIQASSLKPTESITSVSPSQRPIECPKLVGSEVGASSVHVDHAERMRPTRLKQVDATGPGQIQQFDAVGGLKRARAAGDGLQRV